MNFLKKNKKLIIGIITGGILFGGITGFAVNNYYASNILYKNDTTVAEALNDLYANKKDVSALNTIQTAVNQTTATANDILSGKKAYTKDGLITGNKTDNCISGSHIWTQEDSDNGLKLCDFTPSAFAITGVNKDNNFRYIFYYNNQISTSGLYLIRPIEEVIEFRSFNNMTSFVINDGLKLKWATGWVGQQINYMVSK